MIVDLYRNFISVDNISDDCDRSPTEDLDEAQDDFENVEKVDEQINNQNILCITVSIFKSE